MKTGFWIIAYDIADNRRRYRVEKRLRDDASRSQKSVFEGLITPARLRRLVRDLTGLIHPEVDSLRFYPLCLWCQDHVSTLGQGHWPEEADYYVF